MTRNRVLLQTGKILFACAVAGFGVQSLLGPDLLARLAPASAAIGASALAARIMALVLLAAAAGLLSGATQRAAAAALALTFLGWAAVLHLPTLVGHPHRGAAWSEAFITLAIGGGALLLFEQTPSPGPTSESLTQRTDPTKTLGCWLFGVALLVFGAIHYLYHDAIADMIPPWIIGRPYWPYATSAANLAAGLAILVPSRAPLAAGLAGAMFGSWVLVLHVPQVVARPGDPAVWTSLLIALALWGCAWMVAASRASGPRGAPAAPRLATSQGLGG